jgi:hypothetical protein
MENLKVFGVGGKVTVSLKCFEIAKKKTGCASVNQVKKFLR